MNGTSFDSECDDPLRKILQVALNDRVEFQVVRTSFPGKNYALKVNSEYVLVEINFPKITRENVGDLEKLDFNRLDARVEYESFYGDSKVIDTRDSVHD